MTAGCRREGGVLLRRSGAGDSREEESHRLSGGPATALGITVGDFARPQFRHRSEDNMFLLVFAYVGERLRGGRWRRLRNRVQS